ncbi:hypothetical protein [Angustibacter speluncae]
MDSRAEPDWIVLRAGPGFREVQELPFPDGHWLDRNKIAGYAANELVRKAGQLALMLPGLPLLALHPTDEFVEQDGVVGQVFLVLPG